MNAVPLGLADLFRRDLTRLLAQVEAFPSSEMLWQTIPGITNSAGNLVLHLEGNLREYIGRQLGNQPYDRDRPLEFAANGTTRDDLVARVSRLRDSIPPIVAGLSREQMQQEYPEAVLGPPLTTETFVIHLCGHLNWHLGQIDYLRRALSGDGAIVAAGL
jgi:hypothetical protein